MSVYELYKNNRECLKKVFQTSAEIMVLSCIQGHHGRAWADKQEHPESAQIISGDFCFLGGKPSEELLLNNPPDRASEFMIFVPKDEKWGDLIEKIYMDKARKITRYAIKKEPGIFDREYLNTLITQIPEGYEIKLFDKDLYQQALSREWSNDLCAQFSDADDYLARGVGAAAVYGGELVSGASSYAVCDGAIEIEIDTWDQYRRKGLAAACGARLILECLDRGIYPGWDAVNLRSVSLAEKLGYHLDHEYTAYETEEFGLRIS